MELQFCYLQVFGIFLFCCGLPVALSGIIGGWLATRKYGERGRLQGTLLASALSLPALAVCTDGAEALVTLWEPITQLVLVSCFAVTLGQALTKGKNGHRANLSRFLVTAMTVTAAALMMLANLAPIFEG